MAEYIEIALRVKPSQNAGINHSLCVVSEQCVEVIGGVLEQNEASPVKPKQFGMDHIFYGTDPKTASQDVVYDRIGTSIVDNAKSGYNASLFAYGASGSGKTFTMMGQLGAASESRGIIPRVGEALLDHCSSDPTLHVELSYIEIYDDKVYDMLVPPADRGHALRIREHPEKGAYVQHVSSPPLDSVEHLHDLLKFGTTARQTAGTAMNDRSSRSHAVVTLQLVAASGAVLSTVRLVDLAGAERQKKAQSKGRRLKEACDINASLTVLGRVVRDLASTGSSTAFRDSKLTYLLKDSLGGNARTVLLGTVQDTPEASSMALNTLTYLARAKYIQVHAASNHEPFLEAIDRLSDENATLKQQLDALSAELEEKKRKTLFLSVQDRDRIEEEKQRAVRAERERLLAEMDGSFQTLRAEAREAAEADLRAERAAMAVSMEETLQREQQRIQRDLEKETKQTREEMEESYGVYISELKEAADRAEASELALEKAQREKELLESEVTELQALFKAVQWNESELKSINQELDSKDQEGQHAIQQLVKKCSDYKVHYKEKERQLRDAQKRIQVLTSSLADREAELQQTGVLLQAAKANTYTPPVLQYAPPPDASTASCKGCLIQ